MNAGSWLDWKLGARMLVKGQVGERVGIDARVAGRRHEQQQPGHQQALHRGGPQPCSTVFLIAASIGSGAFSSSLRLAVR